MDLLLQADQCMYRDASRLLCSSGTSNSAVTLQLCAFSLPRQWTEANRMQTRTLSSDRRDLKREAVDAQDLALTRQMWSQDGMAQKRSCATVTTMQFMSLAASGGWLDVVGRGMR